MFSKDDIMGVCSYLKGTPEGALRKMMVNGNLTDVHFRLLLKLAKGADENQFFEAFEGETFGKIKLQTSEIKIRELFWTICKKQLSQMGLLTLTPAKTKQDKIAA